MIRLSFNADEIEIMREALRMAASRHETYARNLIGSPRGSASIHDRKATAMRNLAVVMLLAAKICRETDNEKHRSLYRR